MLDDLCRLHNHCLGRTFFRKGCSVYESSYLLLLSCHFYRVPPELSHSIEFAQVLQKAGPKVEQVLRSRLEGMLGNENKAAFIRTDKGLVQVVIFPGEQDAERITITYSKSP